MIHVILPKPFDCKAILSRERINHWECVKYDGTILKIPKELIAKCEIITNDIVKIPNVTPFLSRTGNWFKELREKRVNVMKEMFKPQVKLKVKKPSTRKGGPRKKKESTEIEDLMSKLNSMIQ